MGIYSGRDAWVDGLSFVQSWQANPAVTHQRHSHSGVAGGTNVPPGVTNWTGQIAGVGPQPGVFPGDLVAFAGIIRNSAPLRRLEGSVLIEQLTIDINKETHAPIGWVATFGAQGNMTQAATGGADAEVGEASNGKDLDVKIGGVSVVGNLKTAQIVFRRPHTTHVINGFVHRVAGNLECDINFAIEEDSLEVAAYAPNALGIVRIHTSPTGFWEFKKVRFGAKSNFVVDRTSHNILGYTVSGQWNGAESEDLGYITGPNGVDYYGVSPP